MWEQPHIKEMQPWHCQLRRADSIPQLILIGHLHLSGVCLDADETTNIL